VGVTMHSIKAMHLKAVHFSSVGVRWFYAPANKGLLVSASNLLGCSVQWLFCVRLGFRGHMSAKTNTIQFDCACGTFVCHQKTSDFVPGSAVWARHAVRPCMPFTEGLPGSFFWRCLRGPVTACLPSRMGAMGWGGLRSCAGQAPHL
jgi:hypothetical protein